MQRGIDTFFKRVAKSAEEIPAERSPAPAKKRKALVISSDDDDVSESPQVSKATEKKRARRNEVTSLKDDKKPSLSKLKKVDPTALFAGETKRVEVKKSPKPKQQEVIELEDDDEMDKSLLDIDLEESIRAAHSKSNCDIVKRPKREHESDKSVKMGPTPAKNAKIAVQGHVDEPKIKKSTTQKNEKPKIQASPQVKPDHSDLDSSVLTDEERHERKRMAAILYQKYKNRSSCINPGSKEVPKGKPNCLKGLSFLVTGVLESLERDEAGSIIKEYGGKLMTTVGKRLNYLIIGEDAGPKKLAQAEEFGITTLSEDGLFDLIRTRSGETTETKSNVVDESKQPTTSPKNKKATKGLKEEKIKKGAVVVKQEHLSSTAENKLLPSKAKSPGKHLKNINDKVTVKQESMSDVSVITNKDTPAVSEDLLAWVDKYKPTSVKEIIGQQGAASNVVKLTKWLSKWYINHDGKKKLQKPNPWAKNDDGSYYKAALLSGPPGIGKTTTATLVCKELGFDTVEFNASDTRSKRLLKEEVAELLSNKSLYGYFHGKEQNVSKKHVLIMDEVDGMAGNEDRGGIQELIALIKDSSVPIICMCNDRNHQKMRSLVNYCYDLRFNRPRLEQIKGRILSICFKEKIKMEPTKVEEIISATNNDIRQSINHIALLSAGKELNLKSDSTKSGDKTAQKDLKLGPWDVVRKVFSADEHKSMNIYEKCDLFFHDYSLAPLFVQQNYLQVSPAGPKTEVLQKVARTADALSLGDLVDKRIRSQSAWSLLPIQAVFSSLLPGEYMCGHFTGQINFPGWLGKHSRANKRSRLAQEIHDHTRIRTSGSRLSIRLDYAPFLLASIVRPMQNKGMEGVEQSLEVIKEYHLLREDLDSLVELTSLPGKKNPMDAVDGRVKAALTRTYNKEVLAYSYSTMAGVKKKKTEAVVNDEIIELECEGGDTTLAASDEGENDDIESDVLIKAKKKTTGATKGAKTSETATTKKIKISSSKAKN